jgi:hypothetical protein
MIIVIARLGCKLVGIIARSFNVGGAFVSHIHVAGDEGNVMEREKGEEKNMRNGKLVSNLESSRSGFVTFRMLD